MRYRADIDGIRGIAILLVVLFHFEVGGVENGYLGVDIFFVISGFLITKIILEDLKAGEFSMMSFYCRRIRRLFPALFIMLIAVSFLCYVFFDDESFEKFGYSLMWTSLFSSNFWFWTETGYFAPSAIEKPLLHAWSLSVEEQFYLFFPITLLFCNKLSRSIQFTLITVLFLFSLISYSYGSRFHPDATFFLLPTRIWQLLAGAIIALMTIDSTNKNTKHALVHYIGIFFIMWSVFANSIFTSKIPSAIPCTLGTGLLLIPIRNSSVSNLLASKPLVFFGLISYSLYLWHWPLFVFFKYLSLDDVGLSKKISAFSLSLLLAWLSWKFVEVPIRKFTITNSNRKLYFISTVSFLLICISLGAAITHQRGMPFRHSQRNEIMAQKEWEWHPYGNKTKFHNLEIEEDFKEVDVIGHPSKKPEFLLWGDSHAMALIPGLEIAAKKNKQSFYALTRSSNPPLFNYKHPDQEFFNNSKLNSNILEFIKSHKNIKTVFLSCAWSDYRNKFKLPNDSSGSRTASYFNKLLSETIASLGKQDLKIVIFSQVPRLAFKNFSVRYYFLKSRFPFMYDNANIKMTRRVSDHEKEFFEFKKLVESFHSHNVSFLDLSNNFLDDKSGYFIFEHNGIPLYRDSGHLSTFGSKRLSPFLSSLVFGEHSL